MQVRARVNQADVPRLKVGQEVDVTVEAVAGQQADDVLRAARVHARGREALRHQLVAQLFVRLLAEVAQGEQLLATCPRCQGHRTDRAIRYK